MAGILPEGTAGGLVIRDAAGNPTNPPGVQNAYAPAPAFVSDCELTALPSDCTARIEPKQINAIVSELLAFAECLDPDGPWECTSVTNLCSAFNAWIATYEGSIEDLFVDVAGDTMTGPLQLPIAAPIAPTEATNKKYVDDTIAAAIAAAEGLDETAFVNVIGDTMTGQLTMSYVNPAILLNKQASGESARIIGSMNGKLRWGARFGDETAEAGANVGSDWKLRRYDDAGVAIDDVLSFLRSTGLGTVKGDPTAALGICTKQYADGLVASATGGYTIAESRAAGAVTFAIKTLAGADPSPASPVQMVFRVAGGSLVTRSITAALSITIPSGASLGQNNNIAFRVWLAAFDDAGTVRLAVRVCSGQTGNTWQVLAPAEDQVATSLQPPANAMHQFYTTGAAVAAKFWKWIGFATYEAGLAVAGTWGVAPTVIEVAQQGTPRPGATVSSYFNQTSTTDAIANLTPTLIGTAINWVLRSAANLIRYRCNTSIYLRAAAVNQNGNINVMRDAVTVGNMNGQVYAAFTADMISTVSLSVIDKPNSTAGVVYRPRAQNVATGSGTVQYITGEYLIDELMG